MHPHPQSTDLPARFARTSRTRIPITTASRRPPTTIVEPYAAQNAAITISPFFIDEDALDLDLFRQTVALPIRPEQEEQEERHEENRRHRPYTEAAAREEGAELIEAKRDRIG